MAAEKQYTSFLDKLKNLRGRELLVLTALHIMRFTVIFGAVFLAGAVIEIVFRFSADRRIILTGMLVLSGACLLVYYGFAPARALSGKDRRYNTETLALKVGGFFPEIRDRLLNAIQLFSRLTANKGMYSPALITAAMDRAGASFGEYDFKESVGYSGLKKQSWIFGIFILFLIITVTFTSGAVSGAVMRILNPNTEYPVPASFALDVSPRDTELIRGEPFNSVVKVTGEQPASLKILIKQDQRKEFEEFDLIESGDEPGVYSYAIESVKNSFTYLVRGREQTGILIGRRIDSPEYNVNIIFRPMVRKLKLHLDFPDYSGLASRYLEDNIGDVTALKGTRIHTEISVNKNIKSAEIRFSDGRTAQMNIMGRRAEADITVGRDTRYTIKLEDAEGITNIDPIEYRISAVPDAFPFIQLAAPGEDTDLTEDKRLPVGIRVSDDFGLTGLRLGFRLVDRYEAEEDLTPENIEKMLDDPEAFNFSDIPLQNKQGMMQDIIFVWDMKNIRMFPEDLLLYFAEIYDNDRISGPKRSRTRTFTVRLPSLEELFSQAAEVQEKQEENIFEILEEGKDLQRTLKELSQDMLQSKELDWEQKQKTEEAMRKQEELRKRMEEVQNEIEELVKKFEDNDLLSADVLDKYKELQELIEELASPEMQEIMKKLRESMENAKEMNKNQANMEQFRQDQDDYIKRVERTLKILKRLQIEQMMDELVIKAVELTKTQEAINAELDSLSKMKEQPETENKEMTDELEKLSSREEEHSRRADGLKESMDRLLKKMLDQPDISPEKLAAIAEKTERKELSKQMSEMSRKMFEKAIQESLESGEQIEKDMKEIENDLKDAQEELNENQKQQIVREMRKSLGNLLDLSNKQEEIIAESRDLTVNSGKFRDNADEQYKSLAGLRRTLSGLIELSQKTFFLTPEIGKLLGETMSAMLNSIKSLEQRNKGTAVNFQQKAMESLNESVLSLLDAMRNAQNSGTGTGFNEFMQRMEQLSNQQQGLNQSTLDLSQGGQMTMEQQAAAQRLGRDQQLLQKSLEQLRSEMQGMDSMKDRLGQMGQDMNEVAKQMRESNITDRTLQLQQRILSRMLDTQKSVHRRDFSKKRRSETANPYEVVDPGSLPLNLGESKRLLEEELIKALKEGYNSDFEELIRKYFEKLNKTGKIKKDIKN